MADEQREVEVAVFVSTTTEDSEPQDDLAALATFEDEGGMVQHDEG